MDRLNCFYENLNRFNMAAGKSSCEENNLRASICLIIVSLNVFLVLLFLIALGFHDCFKHPSYGLIFMIMMGVVLVANVAIGIIALLKMLPIFERSIEQRNKIEDRLMNEIIVSVNEDREDEKLAARTSIALVEKNAKTKIEEEFIETTHRHKMEEIELERSIDMTNRVLDLLKGQTSQSNAITPSQLKELMDILLSLTKNK